MKLKIWLFAGLALVGYASRATATEFDFTTAPGAMVMGQPVAAAGSITTNDGGTVTVTLTDTLTGLKDAGELLTDISFQLTGVTATASYASGSGSEENIAKDGTIMTVASGAAQPLSWTVTTSSGTYDLCLIGCGAGAAPATGIIGPGPFTTSNGSIDGNNAHNPFVYGTATFTLDIAGVTSATAVNTSSVQFSFGTTAGNDSPGVQCTTGCTTNVPFPTPEPGSLLLLGSGLVAAAAALRRRTAR